jgi:Pro-kumamolisin, activation domain
MRKHIIAALGAVAVAAWSGGDFSATESTPTVAATPGTALTTVARQQLSGHLKPALKAAAVVGRVPASTPVKLTIALPVKDQGAFEAEMAQISDSKSPKYRHYLTLDQFADKYGASPSDYDAVVAWAKSKNFKVTTHPSRIFVGVSGVAGDVEQALNIHLNYALRPDGTRFYEPDAEPSLDLSVPVQHISHLDDYEVPWARTTPQVFANAAPSHPRREYAPASVVAFPGARCELHLEGSSDPALSIPVSVGDDGVARFHAVRATPADSVRRLALDCTLATGAMTTYPVDLQSEATFSVRPLDLGTAPGLERPALHGDPLGYSLSDLVRLGYGLRPDPEISASAYARWLASATRPA